MVLEITTIIIKEYQNAAFENAFEKAIRVLAKAEGYISCELLKGVENTRQYIVMIKWERLEDHLIKFQGSDLFREFAALMGPYFDVEPDVEHFELISETG